MTLVCTLDEESSAHCTRGHWLPFCDGGLVVTPVLGDDNSVNTDSFILLFVNFNSELIFSKLNGKMLPTLFINEPPFPDSLTVMVTDEELLFVDNLGLCKLVLIIFGEVVFSKPLISGCGVSVTFIEQDLKLSALHPSLGLGCSGPVSRTCIKEADKGVDGRGVG